MNINASRLLPLQLSRHSIRSIRTSSSARDVVATSQSTETKAAEETQDVTALDKLLKIVSKSNIYLHELVPEIYCPGRKEI